MGSINLDSLKNTERNVQAYTYTDLYLDLAEEPIGFSGPGITPIGSSRDMKVAFDLNAIKNSLQNLFNTAPGERFLLPEYGEDLRRFLFERMDEGSGQQLGRSIKYAITTWEPRVQILSMNISVYVDRLEYDIDLELYVPSLQKNAKMTGVFTREGFFVRG